LGMVMVFSLVTAAKDWLEANNLSEVHAVDLL
jgi:hypothetical protein